MEEWIHVIKKSESEKSQNQKRFVETPDVEFGLGACRALGAHSSTRLRRTDNAAIEKAVAKAQGEADKVRHEQRRKLDRDVKNALLRSKRVFGCV